jgi:hypothetical protein
MYYSLLGLLLLVPLLLWAVLGVMRTKGEPAAGRPLVAQEQVKVGPSADTKPINHGPFTRQEIAERLKALSESEPPKALNDRGAMCYKPSMAPTRADYVCPKCGSRTLYTTDPVVISTVLNGIPAIRQIAKELQSLELQIDESQFCKKCSPKVKAPQINMTLRYSGEKEKHLVHNVSAMDLKLIREFLSGEDKHRAGRDVESPLKDHLKRIEELLGISIEAATPSK